MKRKRIGIRIIAGMCAALSWWGLLYPELALTPDTVKVIRIEKDNDLAELPEEWDFDGSLYQELLKADRDQIRFRSKLFTSLQHFLEAFQNENK